jgi:hypothetical protein
VILSSEACALAPPDVFCNDKLVDAATKTISCIVPSLFQSVSALKTVSDVLRSAPSIQLVRLVLRDSDTMSVHEKALKSLMQDQSL